MKTNLTTNSILRNSQIPTINISKETLKLIIDSLESEEVLTLFETLYGYLYENEEPSFKGKALTSVWNNLISTSERFSKSYFGRKAHIDKVNEEKKKAKQSALQDTVGNEFDVTPVNNNIPNNLEKEIKAILSPENTTDDNLYIQDRESGLNSLKMGKNDEFEIEDNIDEINNKEISENMGQCLGTLDELKTKNQDIEVIMQNWFEDDDNAKMYNRWVNALVQYKFNTTPENEEMALGADRKLIELCDILNIQNKNEYLEYVKEDIDYKIAIIEKNQRIA